MRRRLLNISCYLGLAPIFWLLSSARREKNSIGHHCQQALALSFLLFWAFFIFVICFSLHQMILYLSRDLFMTLPIEIPFYVLGGLLALWLILWLVGMLSAVRGAAPAIPLFSRITSSKKRMLFSTGWALLVQITIVIIIAVAIHATVLAPAEMATANVYMLYDDMGYIPRWVFTLGFYRVSLAATKQWDKESVIITSLSELALNQALQDGRLVYIASHGTNGKILFPGDVPYRPQDVDSTNIGLRLQYVYIAACDAGLLSTAWENAFAPAEVKTFARLSSMTEHILWLLVDGPQVILALE